MLCFYSVVVLLACGVACINKNAVVPAGPGGPEAARLAEQAEAAFAAGPRTWNRVEEAYHLMSKAVHLSGEADPNRYDYLVQAARYAVWLALRAADSNDQSNYAEKALIFCNTAVHMNASRVEGYYYRAISTGLFAQENKRYGRDAMKLILRDARRAVEIEPRFDHGGPHRVLGALYLRAPGPPMGVGSRSKSLLHLNRSYQIDSAYPENLLLLAELFIRMDRADEADELINEAFGHLSEWDDEEERRRLSDRALKLKMGES